MLFAKKTDFFHSLSFRLAVMYMSMFLASSIIVFLITLFVLTFAMDRRDKIAHLDEAEEYASILSLRDMDFLKTALEVEAESEGIQKLFLCVIDFSGKEIFSTDRSNWDHVEIDKEAVQMIRNGKYYTPQKILIPGTQKKILISYNLIGPGLILQIAESIEDNQKFLELFRNTFWGIMVLMIFISLLLGWTMSRRSLKGVEMVTQTAEDITRGDLKKRVQINPGVIEIERLANTFNNMIDRIDKLIVGMKEVTDNIAHDLKIPITRIRGLAEITLSIGRGDEKYQEMAASTIEECDQLLQLINTLLDISERKAGVVKPVFKEFDLVASIRRIYELFQPLAEQKDIRLLLSLPGECILSGDALEIQRLLINVLDNAFKYTPSKGKIEIVVTELKDNVKISITDTGIGISGEDLPFIFRRFYRCDRSRAEEGFGLGLSLAETIAKYHGGNIKVESTLGKGSDFTVSLNKNPSGKTV